MARPILSGLMIALGVAAILIGLSVFLLGPGEAGHMTEQLYNQATGGHGFTSAYSPTADSELRFYAPFWMVYGGILIATARDLDRKLSRVPLLSAVFFAGGVGRVLGYWRVGAPHPAFVGLMVIELVTPLVFLALWLRLKR